MPHEESVVEPLVDFRRSFDDYPLAREIAVVVLVMAGFVLVRQALYGPSTALMNWLLDVSDGLAPLVHHIVADIVEGIMLVGILGVCVALYVSVRNFQVSIVLPERGHLPLVFATAVVPVLLVALTDVVADATGTSTSELTLHFVHTRGAVETFATTTAVSLFVAVVLYLLVAHVVVQSSLRRASNAALAIALTAILIGTTPVYSTTGFLSLPVAIRAAFVVPAIAVAVVATEHVEHTWFRRFAYLPLVAVGCLFAAAFVVSLDGVADILYTSSWVGVVALAAYAYDRTRSLLPPAVAFAAFHLTGEVIVFFFEAGTHP